jgi:predicted dehydrogenase
MIRIGLVGYGHWGPNLARCLAESSSFALVTICDLSPDRLALGGRAHPDVALSTDWRALIADRRLDAVAVATPAALHAEIGLAALRHGKHVLAEKPLARSSAEAVALVEEGQRSGCVLMVDHTFVFSPPVRAIRELLARGEIGTPCYFDSVRIGPGIVRHDVNVLWDLAVHDLSILQHVLPAVPSGVQAWGLAPDGAGPEQIAYLTLLFAERFIAHIHVNWRAPVKTRRVLIGGGGGMLVYDDLDAAARLRVHGGAGRAAAETWCPSLDPIEPLGAVVAHFADCIAAGRTPLSDGLAGLRVVRLLEAATLSLARGGRVIEVNGEGAPAS